MAFLLGACGNPLEPKGQMLDLVVFGVYKAPEGAGGNFSPKFYEMTVQQISLHGVDGETIIFEPGRSGKDLRIIDRPQIVYSKDISDYEKMSFISATVVFDADVVVGGKYQSDYPLSLTSNSVSTTEPFTIGKSQGLRMTTKIEWRNTIVRDEQAEMESISQPRLVLKTESQ